jgi:virulence-associated protein VapD
VYTTPYTFSKIQNNDNVLTNQQIYMFSGCKVNQKSADVFSIENDNYVGVFTDVFINCLRDNQHNVSYLYLYRDICLKLEKEGFSQVPIFSSSSENPNLTIVRASPTIAIIQSSVPSIIRSTMKKLIYG